MTLEQDMRDWLMECFDTEEDREEIESLTYDQLENAISRYYDGGMREFIECCAPIKIPCWGEVKA